MLILGAVLLRLDDLRSDPGELGSPMTDPRAALLHPLQTLRNPAMRGTESLFFQLSDIAGTTSTDSGFPFLGNHGSGIDVTGLFGSFFESYWIAHTKLRRFFLRFRVSGGVSVRIHRRSADGTDAVVVDTTIAGDGGIETIEIPSPKGEPGRLRASLRVTSETAAVAEISWCTDSPPVRDVKVAVAICTFNREEALSLLLTRLLPEQSFARVIVTNQGTPAISRRLRASLGDLIDDPRLTIVEQENFGGAGGFTRGILEALADGTTTHVVLMDDDIEIDGQILERLPILLSYLDREVCIGGAMLDLLRPTILFSAGDKFLSDQPGITHLVTPGGEDISKAPGLDFCTRLHQPDFNGWWCFAFPLKAVATIGLPLPLFIRGDDLEYGRRLQQAGFPTLCWPGIAVWHQPFYLKHQIWHLFYDRRNFLFLCEFQGHLGKARLFWFLLTRFIGQLILYDYDRAEMIWAGLAQFNRGFGVLANWRGSDHAALAKAEAGSPASAALQELPAARLDKLAPSAVVFVGLVRAAIDCLRPAPKSPSMASIAAEDWGVALRHRPDTIAVYDQSGMIRLLARDPRRARRLFCRFLRELAAFARRRWCAEAGTHLTTVEFWRGYLRVSGNCE